MNQLDNPLRFLFELLLSYQQLQLPGIHNHQHFGMTPVI